MVKARLMAMMFLQFFVWGAWYTTIGVYMSEQGMGDLSYMPYIMNAVAAIVAPFFSRFDRRPVFPDRKGPIGAAPARRYNHPAGTTGHRLADVVHIAAPSLQSVLHADFRPGELPCLPQY